MDLFKEIDMEMLNSQLVNAASACNKSELLRLAKEISVKGLCNAAKTGNDAEITRLAEKGVDINATDGGWTAMMYSAGAGHHDYVELLHKLGADVNKAKNGGYTPMYIAAQNGHSKCIEVLHRLSADINKADNDGYTPMYIAAQNDHSKCIEVLHKLGADVNKADNGGTTPMYIAAEKGHSQCIEVLHRLGADVNKANKNGTTPAQIAEKKGHTECVELINRLAVARNPPIRAGRRTPPTATDPNAEGYGDRSLSFVRPVDETFRCDICHNVMVDPTSTVCGHTFCKACIEASLSNASTCPTCEGQARPIVPINALKQLIGSLEVRCPNPPRDGTECPVLTLDDLDHHLSDCSCR